MKFTLPQRKTEDEGLKRQPSCYLRAHSSVNCCHSEVKNERGKGGVSEGERKCSETVIKALILMATKELSL